jgi:hypothetical protein
MGVPSSGAQAAANKMTAKAPNRNIREILFICFLLSMAGMDALIRQADIVRDGYKVNIPLSNVKPNLNFQVSGFYMSRADVERFDVQPAESPCQG